MAAKNVEVEVKLSVRDGRDARAIFDALGAPARGTRDHPVHDVYYDTEDHALLAAGYGFRVRARPDGAHEATLKSFAQADARGLSQRDEETQPHPDAKPDPRLLADGPMRTTIEAATAGEPLVPLARVSGRRRVVEFEPKPGLRVEVAHDRVQLASGEASKAEQEVEIELVAGPPETFADWVRERLRGLRPRASKASKLERALRAARVRLPTPHRIAAARLGLAPLADRTASATVAAAQALAKVSMTLARAFDGARRASVEGVHDVRTTSRRLRAVLGGFRDEVPEARRRDLRRRLEALRRAAGPVRDLDIVRDAVASAGASVDPVGIAAIKEALAARRRRERAALSESLATPRLRELPDRVAETAAATLARRGGPPFSVAGASRLPSEVEDALARRAAIGGFLANAAPPALHALRIAAKRARYGAELFANAFGKPVTAFAEAARALQDELGLVQDAVAVADALRAVVRAVPRGGGRRQAAARAAATLVSTCERKARKARKRIDAACDRLLAPASLRSLFDHLAKRAASTARARA